MSDTHKSVEELRRAQLEQLGRIGYEAYCEAVGGVSVGGDRGGGVEARSGRGGVQRWWSCCDAE